MIPPEYEIYMYGLNPFAALIVSWRDLFLVLIVNEQDQYVMNPTHLLIAAAYAAVFLIIGQMVYKKLEWKFAEVV
ncbi:MAG: hypothetical protein HC873_16305 [Leptolyngbyaceae cyanobacterium SL_1_1]|nr:hypothetical protein [Leptolyngbyaceae cyanobacterium SL_1_1]